jgi:CobQ-like glutamine amidotransferase family enzyme
LFTPPRIAKENANNKVIHTPPTRTSTREINVSTKATNTPSTKKDLILVGTFQDYMNEIVGEDTSLDKDSNASIRIIKPSPIDG